MVKLFTPAVPITSVSGTVTVNSETARVTVTAQVALLPPSAVVTVMVAVPGATAVTTPLALTVATELLLLCQVTFGFVASTGATVAVRVRVLYSARVACVSLRLTLETGILTVTAQAAVLSPSAAVTVMVASPTPTPVTRPFWSTVATEVLSLVHVTLWFVASVGVKLTVSFSVASLIRSAELLLRRTPVRGTVTVTAQVAVWPSDDAVMVAVPPPTAVTRPL